MQIGSFYLNPVSNRYPEVCTCCKKKPATVCASVDVDDYEGGWYTVGAYLCDECWGDQLENIEE